MTEWKSDLSQISDLCFTTNWPQDIFVSFPFLQAKVDGKDIDVKAVMDTWTRQMGYPVVTVRRDGNTITASQSRFLYSPVNSTIKEEFTSEYGWGRC